MEGRNFHTSLLGGFRKSDVVSFLAEEKLQHEEALRDLQRQVEEATVQIKDAVAQRDEAQEQLCAMQEEFAQVKETAARLVHELQAAKEQKEAAEQEAKDLRAALEEQARAAQADHDALRQDMEQLERDLRESCTAAPRLDEEELKQLRQELTEQRRRAEDLERLLAQPDHRDGREHLWALCGKMERTLRQMERMLDGPLRVTCYPEPMERAEEEPLPAEDPVREPQEAPKPRNTVSSLLNRVRRRS